MLALAFATTLVLAGVEGRLEEAFVLPAGARLEFPPEPKRGWYRCTLRWGDLTGLDLGIHESGAVVNFEGVTLLDAGCDAPDVRAMARTRVHYPPAALEPTLRRLAREDRELRSAGFRPDGVALTAGDPSAEAPWLMSTWWYEFERDGTKLRGSLSGRIELPPEVRLIHEDDATRHKGGDIFIGPVSHERDFDLALADSILLIDALNWGARTLHLDERADEAGSYTFFAEDPWVHGGAAVREDRAIVAAFGGGELPAAAFSAAARWLIENGETLVALAPVTSPPYRVSFVTVDGGTLWKREHATVGMLSLEKGQPPRLLYRKVVSRTSMHWGYDTLRWNGSDDDRPVLEVTGITERWRCGADERPPQPEIVLTGNRYPVIAGHALLPASRDD